jgi:hypothetical protein
MLEAPGLLGCRLDVMKGLLLILAALCIARFFASDGVPLNGNGTRPNQKKKRAMNKTEIEIFRFLTQSFPNHIVLSQMALNQAVHSKTSQSGDFVLLTPNGMPVVTVEFNGGCPGKGHFQNDWRRRDAKKARLLKSADIPLVTIYSWGSEKAKTYLYNKVRQYL